MKYLIQVVVALLFSSLPFFSTCQIIEDSGFENLSSNCLSFLQGCSSPWINTHGTADVKNSTFGAYEGSRFAKLIIKKNASSCSDTNENPDRGEGIAFVHNFEAGKSYRVSYVVRGSARNVRWLLTQSLENQGGPDFECNNEYAIPPTPSASETLSPQLNNFNSGSIWVEHQTAWFTPTSAHSQLWLRASNWSSPNSFESSQLFVDNVVIEEMCELNCTEPLLDLNACLVEEDYGSIVFDCNVAIQWELPPGSTAVVIDNSNYSAVVHASPGIYTAVFLDSDECEFERSFEILEICCEEPCEVPTGLYCDYWQAGVTLHWDAVPNSVGYELTINNSDPSCKCGISEAPISEKIEILTNQITLSYFDYPCFSWSVKTICSEKELSKSSEALCFNSQYQDCFPPVGFNGLIQNNDVLINDEVGEIAVYPNPSSGAFNIDVNMEEISDLMLEIFDSQGRVIYQQNYLQKSGNTTLVWKPEIDLPEGSYYLKVTTKSLSKTERIVLLNSN